MIRFYKRNKTNSGFNALGSYIVINRVILKNRDQQTLRRPDANYFRLCTSYGHCCNLLDSAFIEQNQPQVIGKQMGKAASQKSLFTKIGGRLNLTHGL